MTVDRDTLVTAASGAGPRVSDVLDAILPLIADAIHADAHALKHRITAASADLGQPLARAMLSEVDGRILAARLVRSLGGNDDGSSVERIDVRQHRSPKK